MVASVNVKLVVQDSISRSGKVQFAFFAYINLSVANVKSGFTQCNITDKIKRCWRTDVRDVQDKIRKYIFFNSFLLSKFVLAISNFGEGKHREETWTYN